MNDPSSRFTLVSWRRSVGELYAQIRDADDNARADACTRFREARDALFRNQPDTPLSGDRLNVFRGIEYFPYDPKWRVTGRLQTASGAGFEIQLARDGVLRVSPAGRVEFELQGRAHTLTVFCTEGYGGGLWLPFGDGTRGKATFGGGR